MTNLIAFASLCIWTVALLNSHFAEAAKFAAVNNDKVLNIHLVPHTHDDVGWLKTIEQYYYGLNMTIQKAAVQSILDTVMEELPKNSNRTFTYVELKFFSMWWDEQSDEKKQVVRDLVTSGQLSFANGGWCMHDEAATHYIGMIDQTTLGHAYLKEELGYVPTVGWQLDPFGHSSTQASLMTARMGFDSLYFGRIDFRDLQLRKDTQETEGLWSSSPNLNDTVFWGLTGSYSGNYYGPRGFEDFEKYGASLIGLDNDALIERLQDFLSKAKTQSDQTKGNHIMMTMGGDFYYQEASKIFPNLDLLIQSLMDFQASGAIDITSVFKPRFENVSVFYSTPEYYTKQKHIETIKHATNHAENSTAASSPWSVKTDDFFPLSDCPIGCYWTGYFTSRASLKRLERVASSFLFAARQIESMRDIDTPSNAQEDGPPLLELDDAVGVLQHHDGVSGTSKQHVAYDYAKRIQSGMDQASSFVENKLKRLLLKDTDSLGDLKFCQLLNETICDISESATSDPGTDLFVVVYNGLAMNRSEVIGIPVSQSSAYKVAKVKDDGTERDNGDVVQSFAVQPLKPDDPEKHVVYFDTGPLSPLGVSVFRIKQAKRTDDDATSVTPPEDTEDSNTFSLSNDILTVHFNRSTGVMTDIETGDDFSMSLHQEWAYYFSRRKGGAYRFSPDTIDQKPTVLEPKAGEPKVLKTAVAMEVHVEFEEPWLKQVTRLLRGQRYVEVEYTVGPIPLSDRWSKEIITRYSTPIENNQVFYTDANAREFVKRKRNFRPSFEIDEKEPIAGNYYPCTVASYIEDQQSCLSIVTDRSQGGSSLIDGSIELMVQRRMIQDDGLGVAEPLDETDGGITPYSPYGNHQRLGEGVIIKGKHRVLVGKGPNGARLARSEMDSAFSEPLVFVASTPSVAAVPFRSASFSALKSPLPENVMLLTFSLLHNSPSTTFLIRLGHQYGKDEDAELSKPVQVDMSKLLDDYQVISIAEKTLSGNRDYSEWQKQRLDWTSSASGSAYDRSSDDGFVISLEPMEIRTFEVFVRDAPQSGQETNDGSVSEEASDTDDGTPVASILLVAFALAAVCVFLIYAIYKRRRTSQELPDRDRGSLPTPQYASVFETELT